MHTHIHIHLYTIIHSYPYKIPYIQVDFADQTYIESLLIRNPVDIGKKIDYFLATGNLVSQSGLDLMQVKPCAYIYVYVYAYVYVCVYYACLCRHTHTRTHTHTHTPIHENLVS
jgi:hypothetical protein